MPIAGLSERRRLTRMIRIRLGEPMQGRSHPKETDYFVLTPGNGATDEILNAYGPKPRALRMMLPLEVTAHDPSTGDEMVVNEYNRAYGANAGLRCKGTGGDAQNAGTAETTDERWAARIEQATGQKATKLPNGRWQVKCLGTACPKYLAMVEEEYTDREGQKRTKPVRAPEKDQDASCKQVIILRAFLLHPASDPRDPNYLHVFGVAEVASSSKNTMLDVKSGLDMLRGFNEGHRTSALPFTLERRPTTTYHNGRKSIHHTCIVHFNAKEVNRLGRRTPGEVFLGAEEIAEIERLQALGSEVPFESVRDLVPVEAHPKALAGAGDGNGREKPEPKPAAPRLTNDGAEAVAEVAQDSAEELSEEEAADPPNRVLSETERNALKEATGGVLRDPSQPYQRKHNPYTNESLARLKQLIHEYDAANNVRTGFLDQLTVAHRRWILARIGEERPTDAAAAPEPTKAAPKAEEPEEPAREPDAVIPPGVGPHDEDEPESRPEQRRQGSLFEADQVLTPDQLQVLRERVGGQGRLTTLVRHYDQAHNVHTKRLADLTVGAARWIVQHAAEGR